MDEEKYLVSNPQQSILDKLIEEEWIKAMYEAIDNLIEGINRTIKFESATVIKYEQLLHDGTIDDTTKV